ncbi:MAG: hypothetical protein K2O06_07435 [Acetatifactor sp.]|nr:hypothetical protein [Acetatifactor sp.]
MSIRLKFHYKLYMGRSMKWEKQDILKKKLRHDPSSCDLFLITVSRNPSDQLEILQTRQLAQRYYKKFPPYVAGIAARYDEALEVVEELVKECLKARGDCALKEYLLC